MYHSLEDLATVIRLDPIAAPRGTIGEESIPEVVWRRFKPSSESLAKVVVVKIDNNKKDMANTIRIDCGNGERGSFGDDKCRLNRLYSIVK